MFATKKRKYISHQLAHLKTFLICCLCVYQKVLAGKKHDPSKIAFLQTTFTNWKYWICSSHQNAEKTWFLKSFWIDPHWRTSRILWISDNSRKSCSLQTPRVLGRVLDRIPINATSNSQAFAIRLLTLLWVTRRFFHIQVKVKRLSLMSPIIGSFQSRVNMKSAIILLTLASIVAALDDSQSRIARASPLRWGKRSAATRK